MIFLYLYLADDSSTSHLCLNTDWILLIGSMQWYDISGQWKIGNEVELGDIIITEFSADGKLEMELS